MDVRYAWRKEVRGGEENFKAVEAGAGEATGGTDCASLIFKVRELILFWRQE